MFVLDPSNAFLCPWATGANIWTCAANAKVMVLACVGYYHLLVHYQIAIASTHSRSPNIPELVRAQSFLIRVHFTRIQDIHDIDIRDDLMQDISPGEFSLHLWSDFSRCSCLALTFWTHTLSFFPPLPPLRMHAYLPCSSRTTRMHPGYAAKSRL